jgi:chorismate synthase
MSSNIKTIDEPFFPLSPNPTKRDTNHCGGILGGISRYSLFFVIF